MFDFNNAKNKKTMVRIIVGILVACMVLPTAASLIGLLF